MTRDDLISSLARRFRESTGESSLSRLTTTEKGDPIFRADELAQAIMDARDLDNFLAIVELKKEFNDHFDKMGAWIGKAATVATYYQLPRSAFLKLADKAFSGAVKSQKQGAVDPKDMN